ncbi:MAG: cyclase family protein [Bacteroidota bacterium]
MIAQIVYRSDSYKIDLSQPQDLSVSLTGNGLGINAWGSPPAAILPYKQGDFVGSVQRGAAVNFNEVRFSPHSHITHTECVGHITKEVYSINTQLQCYFFFALLITVAPEQSGEDLVISRKQLEYAMGDEQVEAIIVRTLPNTEKKYHREYTNTNPPYLLQEAAEYLSEKGIQHLLVDLPSVDKEKDDGALLAHKAFWNFSGEMRIGATITEFIYVPNTIADGTYFLNLQVAPIENDASPSRPVIYKIVAS